MKPLLLFIALFCSVWANGQTNIALDSAIAFGYRSATYDTVKCLLLYCDTTWLQYNAFADFGVFMMCKKGYEVYKGGIRGADEDVDGFVLNVAIYDKDAIDTGIHLDANKHPLPKSYIVWQVKRIK